LEGYDAERQIILDYIVYYSIDNVVNMAGGPHTGIAQKVYSTGEPIRYDWTSFPVMTEFVLDAIAAPKGSEDTRYVPYLDDYAAEWSWVSPYLRLQMDGYCIMTLNKSRIMVEYWVNNNTRSSQTHSVLDTSICVEDGVVDFVDCFVVKEMNVSSTSISETESTAAPNKTDETDEMWFIIGVVFICLFAVALFVIAWLLYDKFSTKKEVSSGPYVSTNAEEVEME